MDNEVRVILMMDPKLRDRLKDLAKSNGRVLSRQIEWVLKEYVSGRTISLFREAAE